MRNPDRQRRSPYNYRQRLVAAYSGPSPPAFQGRMTMRAILSAVVVLGLCGIAGARDAKADPVGTWKCEYEIGGMKRESTLTVKKDADKLIGTMSWPGQKETELKDLKLKDGTLTF